MIPGTPMLTTNQRVITAAVSALLFWASAFVGTRVLLHPINPGEHSFSPGELALYRYGVASLTLALITCWMRIPLPAWRDLPRLAATGIIGIGIYGLALNYGQMDVSAGAASFIVNTSPLFSVLFASLLLKERLNLPGWIGLCLGLSGVGLIALAEGRSELSTGAGLVFLAALCWALYQILQKPLLPHYGPLGVVCYAIWGGTLFFMPFLPSLLHTMQGAPTTHHAIALYLGVLPGAVSFLAWSYILAQLTVSKATPLLYLVPVLSLLIAWLAIGEKPALLSVLGGIVAIAGVALSHVTRVHTTPPVMKPT
jgi:drug/metabolite transporter (DMT)-like permease